MKPRGGIQAVILAGGLGTRLLPLTRETPKSMVAVRGVPYMEHQLRFLRGQQIRSIAMLIGYLGEQIEDYFGDGSDFGLTIRYSREEAPLGTGGALIKAKPMLDEAFLLIYGDSFLPLDYADVCRRLAAPVEAVIAVYDNLREDTGVPNNIALDGESFVTRYEKNSDAPELTHVDAGVLAMRRSALERCSEQAAFSLEKKLYPRMIASRQLLGYPTEQRFYDIGTPEGLKLFENFLRT